MSNVKSQKRPYRSPKRAAQAAETREAILSAAHRLFLSEGWTKATIAAIAAAAGVSNETVYGAFGSKKALLQELVSRTVRGSEPETPLTEQQTVRNIAQEREQGRQIELFAVDITKVLARIAPLMDAVRGATGTDREITGLYAALHRGRRKNLEWFASALIRNGPLRENMDSKAAGTILWRLASPDLFLLMRRVEGASLRAYANWLAASLKLLLLEE
ncbi:MAG: TetR/AcrR family transcriptional regulator [Azospirillaceae bacterium]